MRVKIRGGTVDHGQPSLCLTCRFATVVRGARVSDAIIECGQLSSGQRRITFARVSGRVWSG